MDYQEKKIECRNCNIIVANNKNIGLSDLNHNTSLLIDLYYRSKKRFLSAYNTTKKQFFLKNSNKKIDNLKFDREILEANFRIYIELKPVIRILEIALNILPDKPIDSYEINFD